MNSNQSEEGLARRTQLAESLHDRNYYSVGTSSRQRLTETVDQTLEACSDAMVLDIHSEYFRSPFMAKRIHTGFREGLHAYRIHELAVLTSQIHIAENLHLISHLSALHTYSKFGLSTSENYALENERIRAQCSALIAVSYTLHGYENNRYIVWDADALTNENHPCPRLNNEELITYLLEAPENAPLLVKTIEERGDSFSIGLMRDIAGSTQSISEGVL